MREILINLLAVVVGLWPVGVILVDALAWFFVGSSILVHWDWPRVAFALGWLMTVFPLTVKVMIERERY